MPKQRVLYYRRVRWFGARNHSLQAIVDRIHQRLATTHSRTFDHHDGQLQGINITRLGRPACSMLHVTYYVPRQPTSLVPDPAAVPTSNTVERRPPEHHSYMDGDVFLLLHNNDLVLCNSGVREGAAKAYLGSILTAGGFEERFEVDQVADIDKIEMVQREGVKSIRLSASVFRATQDRIQRETKKTSLLGSVADEFLRLYAADAAANLDDLRRYENLQVKIEISFDARRKGGELAAEKLDAAATGLLNDADQGFVIVTKDGNTLTSEDIKVKKTVELNDHGSSVSCEHAWREMREYYDELRQSGVVEE